LVSTLLPSATMTRGALVMMVLAACADHGTGTSNDPVLSGDACAIYTETVACNADAACTWFGTGCACPPNDPACVCSPGACGSKNSGSGSGSGSTSAGCACSNGGVCYEQIGGTATMNMSPMIECTTPTPGSGDACMRITGQGTCTDSTTVSGLCICDNGER
jgi:hypothetical protein